MSTNTIKTLSTNASKTTATNDQKLTEIDFGHLMTSQTKVQIERLPEETKKSFVGWKKRLLFFTSGIFVLAAISAIIFLSLRQQEIKKEIATLKGELESLNNSTNLKQRSCALDTFI